MSKFKKTPSPPPHHHFKHLTYRWLAGSFWSGDSNMIHPLDIHSQFKPILIYSKGKWIKRDRWYDLFAADGPKEKQWHEWQQSLEAVERLVRYFSDPSDLICDPCAGGFTTAVACCRLGRKFVGCDVDKTCVVKGQKRVAAAWEEVEA